MKRGLAILLAAVPVLASVIQLFVLFIVLLLGDSSVGDASDDADTVSDGVFWLLIGLAVVVLGVALVYWLSVGLSVRPVSVTFVLQLAAAGTSAAVWLYIFPHATNSIVTTAVIIEACAFASLGLIRSDRSSPTLTA